ncbi:MAG TPA: SUMF1/EgtB/PvdO family nonheme iron enzyme [Thermodesulfovibrionales bacterium]|nr:SUMF1/EgtB/PvdO family nonheme iron enzyme [Thermodesulfovibrionales bacterium]
MKFLYPSLLKLILCITIPITYAVAEEKSSFPGGSYTDPATGMEFVFVRGGCYRMGDTFGDGYQNEKPVHEVCVNDFYVGKFKVTQGQWKAVQGNSPSNFSNCGDNCPVEQVSWDDAQNFVRRINQLTGRTYRLLTEAEWEFAARSGGKNEKYAGTSSDLELGKYAWYSGNSGKQTHPVGQKRPNGLGLYDMSGNVWEWVQDIYSDSAYASHNRNNPLYTGNGDHRVRRGGSWIRDSGSVRAANRDDGPPDYRSSGVGFRLAMTP